jgi:hypothetical protein
MAKELGIESVVEIEKNEEQVESSINSDTNKIDETKSFIDDFINNIIYN